MIKSRITLKQLEAFVYVVDLGTFRAAAAALGTTQPNISARMSALEAALDAKLLLRDRASVRLTDRGATLLKQAREVIWAGEKLLEEAGRRDLIEERLRLGVTELVACTWLQDFLRLLKQAYPSLRVELRVDLSPVIEELLVQGQIDLALQSGPFKTAISATMHLGDEAYVWAANSANAAALDVGTDTGRFFAMPVLTHARHTQAGEALHDVAATRGWDANQIIHSSALSACLPLACEGLGVALLPLGLVRQDLEQGQLVRLEADWVPEPLSFWARYKDESAPRYVGQAAGLAAKARAEHVHKENLSTQKI